MKALTLGLIFASTLALADDVKVQVKSFNFQYDNPKGSGSASSFTMSGVPLSLAGVAVEVEKIDEIFKISVSGAENEVIEFKDAPGFIQDADHMDIDGLNLDLSSKASISMGEGNFNSKDSDLMMKGFSLDCNRDIAQKEVMDQLLNGCVSKMTLRSADFSSDSKKEEKHALALFTEALHNAASKNSRGETRVKNVKLNVEGGKYDLAAEIKADVSGKVTSDGSLSYSPEKGVLTVKISQVKFSILSITGKVFAELKKQQSDRLKVKEPYVYITVK